MTLTLEAKQKLFDELQELICDYRVPSGDDFDPEAIEIKIGTICTTLNIPRDRYPGTLGRYPDNDPRGID